MDKHTPSGSYAGQLGMEAVELLLDPTVLESTVPSDDERSSSSQ